MGVFLPLNFCSGRIVPVPKKERVCGQFTDYRPVTTVSVMQKFLNIVSRKGYVRT